MCGGQGKDKTIKTSRNEWKKTKDEYIEHLCWWVILLKKVISVNR